jgi:hypothetical protein
MEAGITRKLHREEPTMHEHLALRLRLLAGLWLVGLSGPVVAASPFDTAIAVWHMNGANDPANRGGPIAIQGDVELGVPLSGAEREASLRRGGDGRVARFRGGCLRLGASDGQIALQGKEVTISIRLQQSPGDGTAYVLSKTESVDPYANLLFQQGGHLHYVWQTEPLARRVVDAAGGSRGDKADGVLRVAVPIRLIDPGRWHDVVVRFRGPNLELFVDGVLVDEEWPHGSLRPIRTPLWLGAGYEGGKLTTGFRGQVDHVALWNRALTNAEIAALAGGPAVVARRDREMFGPPQASIQYWKPRGYNAWAGDCMPFYHDGTFHLFYLFDRHHHGSKWGQGAHQYAHASTRDLVHWEHHPLAVPIVRQWECSMGTCDCIWHDGLYRIFYTDCGGRCEYRDKPQRGSWIFMATSSDGIHFHKDLKPLVAGGDCTVFRDPATGLFHMVRGGGNRLVSSDLRSWKETPGDFVARKPGTSGECPHLFEWNGWYYFILGTNGLWKSRAALGPWEEMEPTIYDGLFVPKVAEFTGNRRILAGFIFERGWAGHLALRELVQGPDGSLGMKFAPELIPACGPPAAGDRPTVSVNAGAGFSAVPLVGVPRNARVTLRVVPAAGAQGFGVCFRGRGEYEDGCELRFEPSRQRAQYGRPFQHGPAKDAAGRVADGRDFALDNVEGLDRPFRLDIIVKNDLVDTCIDCRRTMITRRDPAPDGDRLFLFARQGRVAFESIEIRPLVEPGNQ